MINYSTLQTCLFGQIGFRNNYSSDFDVLDTELTSSASGLFVDHTLHPLLSHENILACAEHFAATSVRSWSNAVTYQTDDVVYNPSGGILRSIQNTNLNKAISNTDYWASSNLISNYLRIKMKGAINNLLSNVFTLKKLNESAKTLLADSVVYEGWGNISDLVTKAGRFVFWRLTPVNRDTVIKIKKVGLQFTNSQTITLYFFHSSRLDSVQTVNIVYDTSYNFKWFDITEISLPFMSDTVNAGGSWYVGYFENNITGSAIKKEVDFIGGGCGSCGNSNYRLFQSWNQYFQIQPGFVSSTDINGTQMWNNQREVYVDNTTFGLNFQVRVECDVTDTICRNKTVLADALRKQVMVDIITDIAYSMRDNQLKMKAAQMAAYALDNRENYSKGLKAELDEAIKAIDLDFSSLSSVCLPCANGKHGIRSSSMY